MGSGRIVLRKLRVASPRCSAGEFVSTFWPRPDSPCVSSDGLVDIVMLSCRLSVVLSIVGRRLGGSNLIGGDVSGVLQAMTKSWPGTRLEMKNEEKEKKMKRIGP